jgi:dUTP pyrophosphatase
MTTLELHFLKIRPEAIKPVKATTGSSGFDLFSASKETISIEPFGKALIPTGLSFIVKLPSKYYLRIASRSGLALHHHIHVGAGVIDPDYQGEVFILLYNLGNAPYKVNYGERVAQLICENFFSPELIQVTDIKDVEITKRKDNGFGSTGK